VVVKIQTKQKLNTKCLRWVSRTERLVHSWGTEWRRHKFCCW